MESWYVFLVLQESFPWKLSFMQTGSDRKARHHSVALIFALARIGNCNAGQIDPLGFLAPSALHSRHEIGG
ncbi:hypothetical protein HBH56_096700 [Parastagonospora nodorum]|uniref:Uncharacterized protein n=1 Tax=Phaeosphaeria nodorum (strain SN15 / ATCC MYA-4574 / FGSC 10173) TaxID=321614 RepID=A0A7U2NR08_PHANO|nr:hypothetical protein HBH56_096700 [Parastagonospora nodorum]QRD07261.1 hypothetical protein JI435_424150 [Parastagonospora nodorum SN15]KAH3930220.1 hypothetical protein HBH54_111020 [Parastagonospora nodorum]KAH3945112.1 hypothetical protein HBH53_148420 [Parastagonospora nodorum]KAH3966850.1 hypothetical protein HBH51_139830 [Parastagonospora nodorum]